MTTLTARIGVKLGRGQNEREHHRAKAERVKAERTATGECLWAASWTGPAVSLRRTELGARITLVRPYVATPLDTDNLSAAFKAVRDAIAQALGVDDGSSRLHWVYEQPPAVVLGKSIKKGKTTKKGRVIKKDNTRPSLDHDTRPTVRIEVVPVEDIDPQRRAIRILRAFARDVAESYDHDEDAHRYGTGCRCCRAETALAQTHDQEQP